MTRLAPAAAVALLALIAAAGADARAQDPAPAPADGEPVSLATTPRAGDVAVYVGHASLDLKVRVATTPAGGGKPGAARGPIEHETEAAFGSRQRWAERVLEVKDGHAVRARRRYLEYREVRREPGAARPEEDTHPIEGKEIVLKRDERGRVSATGLDPTSARAVADLAPSLAIGERFEGALAERPVRPGESWAVEGERLRACLGSGLAAGADGRLEATLAAVESLPLSTLTGDEPADDEPVVRVARVEVRLELRTRLGEDGPALTAELAGSMLFDLDRARLARVALEGPARFEQVTPDPGGGEVRLTGRGAMRIDKRVRDPRADETVGGG